MNDRIKKSRLTGNRISGGLKIFAVAGLFAFGACTEAKRFEIGGNDGIPPGVPIFIDQEPLAGGVRVFFKAPADEDLMLVEASYVNTRGKTISFSASYFTDHVDVMGFGAEGEYEIELCAVDRSGNRSEKVTEFVTVGEPPLIAASQTVKLVPSFEALIVKWENALQAPIYITVEIKYEKNGKQQIYTTMMSSFQKIDSFVIQNLGDMADAPILVTVSVADKFDNETVLDEQSLSLLKDVMLDKEDWSLLPPGTVMGGVTQSNGNYQDGDMEEVIDGLTEKDTYMNFYRALRTDNWNIIIDLGEERELSRIVTHQRYTGEQSGEARGNYYRGDNVLTYIMYIWNEAGGSWEQVSRNTIPVPVVKQNSDYKILGDAGDEAFLYPEEPKFSKETRYFRFEAVNGSYISEITLYGKAKE